MYIYITPGMVRANGKAQANAVRASLWDFNTAAYTKQMYRILAIHVLYTRKYNGLIRQCA